MILEKISDFFLWVDLHNIYYPFLHRFLIMHEEDSKNPLVWMQLHIPYGQAGSYKAGKSYVVKSWTRIGCGFQAAKTELLEKIDFTKPTPNPYSITRGCYDRWSEKKYFCQFLAEYVRTITILDPAYYYITNLDNKIAYLKTKIGHDVLSIKWLYGDTTLPVFFSR